jgi:restriction endonuclease S subunit
MNNLQANGWDLSALKYVEVSETEFKRWRLEAGDIVINRTNSKELVGKSEVFQEPGDWLFASYLMRLRVNTDDAVPAFISAFLSTRAGRAQIDRESRQIIGMSNINAEEIRTIRVPLPPKTLQTELVRTLSRARETMRQKLADADSQLTTLDEFVLETLGIQLTQNQSANTTYAVREADVRAAKKLHPDFFHPERVNAIRVVHRHYGDSGTMALSEIADFIRKQRKTTEQDSYLGLANVQSNTGEKIENSAEDGKGTVYEYENNDVLFARLRPYLNKVYRAESDGVCSTEFHVIRIRTDADGQPVLLPDYLACVLRSSVVLSQTRHMMTGNTHPRLANEDVSRLVVPVPSGKIQHRIASEISLRRNSARLLREDARTLWEQALLNFEEQLLGAFTPQNSQLPRRVADGAVL